MLVRDWKKEIIEISNSQRLAMADCIENLLAWKPFNREYKELNELRLLLIHLNNG